MLFKAICNGFTFYDHNDLLAYRNFYRTLFGVCLDFECVPHEDDLAKWRNT